MSKNLSANIINNINEEYFGGTEFKDTKPDKERISDIAYKFCGEIANDDELEAVIKEMTWWLKERRRQTKEMKEDSYGDSSYDNTSASKLFNAYADMQSNIEDFADKWNNCKGYPDEVKRQRIKLINPVVVEFVNEYADDLKYDWESFEDIMTENNYHTALEAIEKELSKYD